VPDAADASTGNRKKRRARGDTEKDKIIYPLEENVWRGSPVYTYVSAVRLNRSISALECKLLVAAPSTAVTTA
jgi:hypothetical protein